MVIFSCIVQNCSMFLTNVSFFIGFKRLNFENKCIFSGARIFFFSLNFQTVQFKFDENFHVEPDTACSYDFIVISSDGTDFRHGRLITSLLNRNLLPAILILISLEVGFTYTTKQKYHLTTTVYERCLMKP